MLDITEPGYQDFRRDASCIVRPQNLIGERFVECKPTQRARRPPPRRRRAAARSTDGPGKGQYLLPVTNTMQTVDIDLIGNTMREPERERLSLILNELGTGAGRPRRATSTRSSAAPTRRCRRPTRSSRSSRARTPSSSSWRSTRTRCSRRWRATARSVASAIRNTSEVAEATAEKRDALADDIQTLPQFLDELRADDGAPRLAGGRRPRRC